MSILTNQQQTLAMICSKYLTHLSREYVSLESEYDFIPDDAIAIFKIANPTVNLTKYIERLIRYLKLIDDDIFYAIGLIEHFICICAKRYTYILTPYTVHELLATSILITMKINTDAFFGNKYCAKVFGVSDLILARCELNFLVYLQFSVIIPTEIFEKYKRSICISIEESLIDKN